MGRNARIRGGMVGWMILLTLGSGAPANAQDARDESWTRLAQAFVRLLQNSQFDSAAGMISPAVPPRALGAAQLREIWSQLRSSAGSLTVLSPGRVITQDTMRVVDLAARFERESMTIRVVFMPDRTVGGLWFLPAAPPAWEPPAYASQNAFDEIEIQIGAEPWLLPATLTVPKGEATIPVVILVHGSGPHDRDETIGPNRPFKDIAWGLASNGVAVLRYEKRTRAYAGRLAANITVEAEVIEDALAAIRSARNHPRIDSTRVFLAGHSLGGMMGPEIARRDGHLAGLILMATPARPLQAVVRDQVSYIASLAETDAATRRTLRAVADSLDLLESHTLADTAMVMGAPASYYYDLEQYNAVATAYELKVPLFVLHGGRDYQVTERDLGIWAEAFDRRVTATVVEYDALNHLFMEGRDRATPAEYARPGHVAEPVIRDLYSWILNPSGG